MIQFIGLHLGRDSAAAIILGRDLQVWAHSRARVVNTASAGLDEAIQVPVAEWLRAGSFALQEAYFQLPVNSRKTWGVGIAGPSGFVALDVDFKPLSPLLLTSDLRWKEELKAWRDFNPRLSRKISVVLSPKDYFRFALSGGLAADVVTASRLDLLRARESHWSEERVREAGIERKWLPPVFDAHVPTGRLSEEGMRRTSLPGGLWLVAGAHETESALVAAGDLRDGKLRLVARAGGRALLALDVPHLEPVKVPPGWQLVRSALAGRQVLEQDVSGTGLEALGESGDPVEEPPALAAAREALEGAGHEVRGAEVVLDWSPEAGAAALAGIGSGLVKGWDAYYKSLSAV